MSRGHDKDKLLYDYSIKEVLLFTKAALKNQSNMLVQLLVGVRVASHAKPEAFERYVKELQSEIGTKKKKATKKKAIAKLRQFGLPR